MMPKRTKDRVTVDCEVNGVRFHAEGTQQEVAAKLRVFMDEVFAPVKNALERAGLVARRPQ
jgi:hypothetical protein